LILKRDQVVCFDTLLQVLILNSLQRIRILADFAAVALFSRTEFTSAGAGNPQKRKAADGLPLNGIFPTSNISPEREYVQETNWLEKRGKAECDTEKMAI
jgi:hypothetical protein